MSLDDTFQSAGQAVARWAHDKHLGHASGDIVTYIVNDLYAAFAKELQDMAYSTYASNISWSRDLDAILASAPGYLKRA